MRASSASSPSKREEGRENKVGPGVIAFLPKILNSLRWNLSELRENELIVLLKLAHIAITELDPAWLEESCIETTGVATYKQGGNRINKLKFIARNKSGKLKQPVHRPHRRTASPERNQATRR